MEGCAGKHGVDGGVDKTDGNAALDTSAEMGAGKIRSLSAAGQQL